MITIAGSDLVKIAKIFGIDADESDIVYHKKYSSERSRVEFAGDIIIPIWRGRTEEIVVDDLLIRTNLNGSLDIDIHFNEDEEAGRITYNGRYYVEWSPECNSRMKADEEAASPPFCR